MSRYKKLLERVEELEADNKWMLNQLKEDTYEVPDYCDYPNNIYTLVYSYGISQRMKDTPTFKAKLEAMLQHSGIKVEVEEAQDATIKVTQAPIKEAKKAKK